jgi:hypothetical protein
MWDFFNTNHPSQVNDDAFLDDAQQSRGDFQQINTFSTNVPFTPTIERTTSAKEMAPQNQQPWGLD